MNPRIKELANKAYGITDAKPFHPSALVALEAFAELIVRECLEIVEDEDDGSADTKPVRWAMIRIKKHFGVEE